MIVDNEKSWSELNKIKKITPRSLRFQPVILFSVPVIQVKVRATMYIDTSLQLRATRSL